MAEKQDETRDKRVVIATVGKVYGVQGWVKIISHTDPPENAFNYQPWLIKIEDSPQLKGIERSKASNGGKGRKGGWQELKVAAYKRQTKDLIVRFDACNDRDEARQYTGLDIYVDSGLMPPLEEDEFYWHDLEGLKVINQNDLLLGEVDHLIETGSNDVLVLKACEGSFDKKERLIPFLMDQVIKKVDFSQREIRVDWEEGF